MLVGVHLYSFETAKFVLNYVFKNKLNGHTFSKHSIIPIVIGKHCLTVDNVREVLVTADIVFADLRLDKYNKGKVLFEPLYD